MSQTYDFKVRPASDIWSRLFRKNEKRFELVINVPPPVNMGRLQNSWFSRVMSEIVIPQERVLQGDFGNLPFHGKFEKDRFAEIAGRAILDAIAHPERYSSNSLHPSPAGQGGIHPS